MTDPVAGDGGYFTLPVAMNSRIVFNALLSGAWLGKIIAEYHLGT